MNTTDTTKYINRWISKNGYSSVFKGSVQTILQENRRHTRPKANARKYDKIPFQTDATGHVHYDLLDIQNFCETKLKTICSKKQAEMLARASGLKYYSAGAKPEKLETLAELKVRYGIPTPTTDDSYVVTDAELEALLSEVV
jgi:hypothetical protein